jgi:hypothetical protein
MFSGRPVARGRSGTIGHSNFFNFSGTSQVKERTAGEFGVARGPAPWRSSQSNSVLRSAIPVLGIPICWASAKPPHSERPLEGKSHLTA